MGNLVTRFVLAIAFFSVSLSAPVAHADDTLAKAKEATAAGEAALKAKDYSRAVEQFERAVELWKQIETSGENSTEASRFRKRCEDKIRYAVERPLAIQLQAAGKLARDGDIEGASDAYYQLALAYDRASEKYDYGSLKQNRVYCANAIGMVAIKKAEELQKQKNYSEAARYYRMAVDRYRAALDLVKASKREGNIAYAEEWMHRMEFADLLQRHAEAPEFELTAVGTSERVRLSNFRGKPTLVVFWAAWCPSCKYCLPILSKFQHEVGEDRLAVVGVCVDRVKGWDRGRAEKAETLVRETLTFPNAWGTQETTNAWGNPKGVPTMYWVDSEGRLIAQVSSRNLTLERLLEQFEQVRKIGHGNSGPGVESAE